MSYQVLARKWRPQFFKDMVGQEHVMRALINALDNQRLHHAYLFTGTRGVGKTTIARILAKCLNCDNGISSEPCGTCSSCTEISEGRFVDLIEVDAASRTKVEDTREILDNVQYAPTRGRFKVYLIDEVHMLSNSSFNALLKTLEEPPPHVKFLLATTDPQKLPATILSRCLQFSLKNMSPERIVGYLQHVLAEEKIPFEDPALWLLGRAAEGSMRDALSLTDQSISFGQGRIGEQDVATMLGTVDRGRVFQLAIALAEADAPQAMALIAQMAEHAVDFNNLLADLLSLIHRIAIAQAVPDAVDNSQGDKEQVMTLAQAMSPAMVQLLYQVALTGKRDLPLAPDPRSGMEMTLLRMINFAPIGAQADAQQGSANMGVTPVKKPELAQLKRQIIEQRSETSAPSLPATAPSFAPAEREPALAVHSQPVNSQPVNSEPVSDPRVNESSVQAATDLAPAASTTAIQPETSAIQPETSSVSVNSMLATEQSESFGSEQVVSEPLVSEQVVSEQVVSEPLISEPAIPEHTLPAEQTAQEPFANMQAEPHVVASDVESALVEQAIATETHEPQAAVIEVQSAAIEPQTAEPEPEPSFAPEPETPLVELELSPQSWPLIFNSVAVEGMLRNLVANTCLMQMQGNELLFHSDGAHMRLFGEAHQQKFQALLNAALGSQFTLQVVEGYLQFETPAQRMQRLVAERQAKAVQSIEQDVNVQALRQAFDAQVIMDSITPLNA